MKAIRLSLYVPIGYRKDNAAEVSQFPHAIDQKEE